MPEAAAAVFRLGLERYGDREPALLAAYVNFLLGRLDFRSAWMGATVQRCKL